MCKTAYNTTRLPDPTVQSPYLLYVWLSLSILDLNLSAISKIHPESTPLLKADNMAWNPDEDNRPDDDDADGDEELGENVRKTYS